jgi:LacI family transcriptional regulator
MLPMTYGYSRDVARGVGRFVAAKSWRFEIVDTLAAAVVDDESIRGVDGVIAHVATPAMAKGLLRHRKPTVNVSGTRNDLPIPRVGGDDREVGRLAARHLLGRGYATLAFVGYYGHHYSEQRWEGFRREAARAGATCHRCPDTSLADAGGRSSVPGERARALVSDFLLSLPRPAGVLACSDRRGRQLAELMHELGLAVPTDLALMGVDDDDLLCDLTSPRLSSVAIAGERIGYEAARLLERWMEEGKRPPRASIFPPLGVVARQSTDHLAAADPAVAGALRFIKRSAHQPIGVDDLAGAAGVSRRTLELRFGACLGKSPLAVLSAARVDLARQMLTSTDEPLTAIARRCGFGTVYRLGKAFTSHVGVSPAKLRARLRPAEGRG